MKINGIIKYLSLVGIAFSIYLVVRELIQEGYCPDFFGTPACWLVLLAFVLVFLSTLLKKGKVLLFYPGAFLGLVLAVYFSLNQLLGIVECPKMFGIPLCYVSFITFVLMTVIFLIGRKLSKNRKVEEGEV